MRSSSDQNLAIAEQRGSVVTPWRSHAAGRAEPARLLLRGGDAVPYAQEENWDQQAENPSFLVIPTHGFAPGLIVASSQYTSVQEYP
jgi:hypothetical protein